MLADYIHDGIISLYNLALGTLSNIATLNIYIYISIFDPKQNEFVFIVAFLNGVI